MNKEFNEIFIKNRLFSSVGCLWEHILWHDAHAPEKTNTLTAIPTVIANILQEIIITLKQVSINPLCVNILNKPKEEMKDGFAIADGPLMIEELLLIPPTLIFSQELINKRSREDIGFLISHEIGHLILCHYNATYFLEKRISRILMKKSDIHQSTNMQYHWLKRIHDLHKAQETAKE